MPNTAIWRMDLYAEHCRLQVPPGAVILSVGERPSTHIPSIWFAVDPSDTRRVTRRFVLVMTGVPVSVALDRLHLIGRVNSAPVSGGNRLVYHVFEVPQEGT